MSESVLKKFGKYFLLDRVGEGGMAEIFRARVATHDANGRLLVIKRIQAAFGNNPEFLQMFRAEVQVTMRFTHPNIVQLYEAGEEAGQQYIAMELVDGRNLRQVLGKVGGKQKRIPVPASCYMIEQTAAGLHYAHTFKDRITGEALNLVHRDVSPQNILVSYDGNIKVIDFGIAKAATNGESTRAGVIKGKLSYLSPEQVLGETLDNRSDVFALGIVLWELLTGKRLFVADGDNEFQVLKMIESCNTFVKPPSTINSEVPKELDEVVMRALTRDPKKRFQSAEEMGKALRRVLAAHFPEYGPSELSIYIKKLFQDLIVEDRKQLQQLNARAEELIALGKPKEDIEGSGSIGDKPKDQTRVTQFIGNKFDKSELSSADRIEFANQPQRQMKVPVKTVPSQQTSFSKQIHKPIAQPKPVEDETPSSIFGFIKLIATVAGIAAVGFFAYQHFDESSLNKENRVPTSEKSPVKIGQRKTGLLKIRIFPDGDLSKTRVTVNSELVNIHDGAIEVPLGELINVAVSRDGFETYQKEFTVKDDGSEHHDLDLKLVPMVYGRLSLSTIPAVATATIVNLDQGSKRTPQSIPTLQTPITHEALPAGHYRVDIANSLGQVESVQFEIKEGQDTVLTDIQLKMKN